MSASNCQKTSEQLSLYLANELPDVAREEIRAHLESCVACREELESLRLLNGAMAMSPLPEKLDAKRVAAIAERFRAVSARAAKPNPVSALLRKVSSGWNHGAKSRDAHENADPGWRIIFTRIIPFVVAPALLLVAFIGIVALQGGQSRPMLARIDESRAVDGFANSIDALPEEAVAGDRSKSESSTSPSSGRKGKEPLRHWSESDRLGRNAMAENKPGGNRRAPESDLKSEISNHESAPPATPALPTITLASAVPPPAAAPATRRISGLARDPQLQQALGEISGATENFFNYTANQNTAPKKSGANGAVQDETPAPGFVVNNNAAAPVSLTAASDLYGAYATADQNGRDDVTRATAAAPASKPGRQFLAAQDDQPVVVNGFIADGTIKDLKKNGGGSLDLNGGTLALGTLGLAKSGGGTLTLDGANAYAGATTVSGGTLAVPPSGGVGGNGIIVANAIAAKPADVTEFEVAAKAPDAKAMSPRLERYFRGVQAEPAKESGGVTLTGGQLANSDRYFDRAGLVDEAAAAATDQQRQSVGSPGATLGWGLAAVEGAGGGAGAKLREMAESQKGLGLLTDVDKHDFGTFAGKEIAMGDTDTDGRDKDVSKRLEEFNSFAVIKSDFNGDKRAEAGDRLLAMDDRRDPAATGADLSFSERRRQRPLEKNDERAKLKGVTTYRLGLEGASPAQPASEETEKLKTEYPKPMFVGTPVAINVPNMEPPNAGGVSTRAYTVPNETMAKFKGGSGYDGLTKQLEEKGIKTPAGSKATYDAETEQLVFTSTPQGLSKLDDVVASLKNSDEQKSKPAASEPVRPAPPREPAGFNPYIDSKDDAFSTFSIDVDTASYTLTRRAIEEGRLPDPEQVRTEEIVNAFDYDYATPASGAFAMHAEFAPSPFRSPLDLLKVGIRGRVLGRDAKKPAVLTLVIDTSGSMDTADRLGRIRPALRMLVDQLKPNDTVAIVAFNNDARLLLDRTRGENKKAIFAAIDALAANGSTQLEGGMKLAYEVAARGFVSGGANRVVLMSDGVANLGAATAQEILASVDQYRKQGIYLTVLGFGSGNYDDAMLMQLADKGDGAYSFVDSDEEAKRLLVDQWEQTLNVIAKDVKIQIEFNPDRVKRWRQIGYEKRHLTKQDFRNDAVDAGEVGSGQSVTALYDIEFESDAGILPAATLSGQDARFTSPIATMRVRYKDPDTGKVTELEQRITDSNRHANFASAPVRFRAAACAAEFAELLRVSPYTAGSDFAAVIEQLRPVAGELTLDQRVQELLRMAERARGLAK